MEKKMNYKDFEPLFGEWANKFKPFIESEQMYNIYQKLKSDGEKEVIVPYPENVFRAFQMTSPRDVKSVWYMMDPYPRRYKNKVPQSTGIAMDCSNSPDDKIQPSLEKFYESMSLDIGHKVERSKSLDYLAEQGVMLLNTDLTCKLNKTESHARVWEPFQKYFLEEVMRSYTGIIYVISGKTSKRMERYIYPISNYIFRMDHPVSASYQDTTWDCKNVFTKINKILKENNGSHIYWDKKEWDDYSEPPF
jgi:uracil-DNA glycosylase